VCVQGHRLTVCVAETHRKVQQVSKMMQFTVFKVSIPLFHCLAEGVTNWSVETFPAMLAYVVILHRQGPVTLFFGFPGG
jgi:hypothetical protein